MVISLFGTNKKSSSLDWIVVFLGNPGDKYENTRHNVGFMTADALGEKLNKPIQRLKFKALTNVVEYGGCRVLLMKPTTYMNLSGEAVREACMFYKLPPERVLVVSDDVSLPVGKIRLRRNGTAGGHNGLRSIIGQLHSDQFPRLKIGVGAKPHPDYDMADWVLGRFSKEDRKAIDAAIDRALDAMECLFTQGIDKAMSRYNG
ncbi:MAG: aminoacyl-tRNA hydrolase [Oscillospiraceae bacterium]|nr:aminoacyl-tRNA hydrolase [Eubacteriales bacterium]MDY2618907.1 aminoacyl-tRNA hydrolase [Oscillospiraceae bacterium]